MYEGVLSCCLFAMKTFNSSFAEVLKIPLKLFLDLVSVYEKTNEVENLKPQKKVKYKVLD